MTVNLNEIYRDPLLYQWYNPSFSYSENVVVINGKSILTYIPDEFQRVQINGKVETNKIPQNTNEFKVNYHLGIIEFHPTIQNGSNFTVTYYARGIIKHPAVRTYIQDKLNLINSDNVEDALQEIFSRINNIVASVGNSNTEIVDARYDGVNNITHPILKSRLDKTDERVGILNNLNTTKKNNLVSAINELNNNFQKQDKQSTIISHGLNIINASQNSPLNIQIEGRTLVNISQNVLDPAKYYVLSDKKSKVKFGDGTTYSGVAKFQGKAEKPILIRIADFENKVPGSTAENPHVAKRAYSASLQPPSSSSFSAELTYSNIYKQDGTVQTNPTSVNGEMPQQLFSFNLIEAIERNVGKIPASDTAGKVAWLKNNIARITCNWWGYGQSPSGHKATVARWVVPNSSWAQNSSNNTHSNSTVTKLQAWAADPTGISQLIDSNGFVHFLAYADPSDGTTASTIYTDYTELEIELNQNAQLWNPRFPLYEVDATEYANILTVWDENEVMRRYPAVESVQHVQNPYIVAEGENLLPPFSEWNLHANARVKSPYELELNATGNSQQSKIVIKVNPNTDYIFSYTGNGQAAIYTNPITIAKIAGWKSGGGTLQFNSGNNSEITVILSNELFGAGTFTFTNPMLTLGSQQKPFVPRNPSMILIDGVKLGSLADKKDILFRDNGDWKVLKWIEKDVSIDGKLVWIMQADYTGYKRFNGGGLSNTLSTSNDKFVLTKFDGKELKYRPDTNWQIDEAYCFNNTVSISVSDTDSGWGEHYKPSAQEIQAYFNGWKANGYTTGTAVTNELTGQLAPSGTYTFAKSGAYRNVVVEKSTDNSTWSPATENTDFKIDISGTKAVLTNLSLSALYFRISYNYGVTVNSWASLVDGSAPVTNTLAYVSANMAPGFTPYKLSYVRSTPVTEVVTDKVEGDLVVNGATQIEVGSGVVIREKVVPKGDSSNYYINIKGHPTAPDSNVKYKLSKIIKIYKNTIDDTRNWSIIPSSYAYGNERASIPITAFDTTAEYTVTYLVLDRHLFTTNVLGVTATYDSSLKSVVDSVVAKQSDITAQVSVNVRAIAELYKRIKALGG